MVTESYNCNKPLLFKQCARWYIDGISELAIYYCNREWYPFVYTSPYHAKTRNFDWYNPKTEKNHIHKLKKW